MKLLPEHGPCFVCGTQNPSGMGIEWYMREDQSIYGEITLTKKQQGPPGHAHGGASAALLDEAMGSAAWHSGTPVVAGNLNVNFRRPVPLGVKVEIRAWVAKKSGRKIQAQSELRLPDGQVAVEGTGLFVEAKHMYREYERSDTNSKNT
ncbi:MAG: PaaI family thioesterase [Ardenticatenaceae bacterium]